MKKNNVSIFKNVIVVLVLVLFVTVFSGCDNEQSEDPTYTTLEPKAHTTEPTVEPTALPDNSWKMEAVIVNDKGEVLETLEVTAKVMTWEQEGHGLYSLGFMYPENVYNSGSGSLPYPDDENVCTCSSGVSTEAGPAGKMKGSYFVGFDVEKECFIVDFDDGEDIYLLAYRNSDTDISGLWDHFQDFLALRPESFPEVNW